jgi:hypothetical protein
VDANEVEGMIRKLSGAVLNLSRHLLGLSTLLDSIAPQVRLSRFCVDALRGTEGVVDIMEERICKRVGRLLVYRIEQTVRRERYHEAHEKATYLTLGSEVAPTAGGDRQQRDNAGRRDTSRGVSPGRARRRRGRRGQTRRVCARGPH